MMGRIHTAPSFRLTLNYCLEDKLSPLQETQRTIRENQKNKRDGEQPAELSVRPAERVIRQPEKPTQQNERPALQAAQSRQVIFKDRAEIIQFNQCFGNKQELIRQFNEVRKLHRNMSKPVMHISISFPTGERLSKSALTAIATDCARFMDFDKNQFVTILHKDTRQQHIHIVANRIGFDKKTVSDSYSQGRIADFCREAELRHRLTREPGPRRYQTSRQRQTPRHGLRLDRLREHISQTISVSGDFQQFQRAMEDLGYKVLTGRGITFMDEKKVIFKGSEAGFSLRTIGARLAEQEHLRQVQQQAQEQESLKQQQALLQIEEQRQHRQRLHRSHHL